MAETTRDEHLQWCKDRALEIVRGGDPSGAVASMISDLRKWKPLYDAAILQTLWLDGVMFRKTTEQVTDWIEGFN